MYQGILFHSLYLTVVLAYTVSAAVGGLALARPQRGSLVSISGSSGLIGFLALLLTVGLIRVSEQPLLEQAGEYYLWVAVVVEALFRASRIRSTIGRLAVSATCLPILMSAAALSHRQSPFEGAGAVAGRVFFIPHIVSALLAESCLVLTGVVGVGSIIIDSLLRRRAVGSMMGGGLNLVYLDQAYRRLILAGFLLMTVSIGTGALWAISLPLSAGIADATFWFALAGWGTLGVLVYLRYTQQVSLIRIARPLSCFIAGLFLCYFASAVFLGDVFHRG